MPDQLLAVAVSLLVYCSAGRELSASVPLAAMPAWRSSHWSRVEAAAGPSILAALVWALRQAVLALVHAAPLPCLYPAGVW